MFLFCPSVFFSAFGNKGGGTKNLRQHTQLYRPCEKVPVYNPQDSGYAPIGCIEKDAEVNVLIFLKYEKSIKKSVMHMKKINLKQYEIFGGHCETCLTKEGCGSF